MVEEEEAPVQVSLSIPVQDGLKHEVWLAFQNGDELHFGVGHFWLEWFPCTDPEVVTAYIEAVSAFLAGRARVLERYRGDRCVGAKLQLAGGSGWSTIGTWSRLSLPFPWSRTYRELRNA